MTVFDDPSLKLEKTGELKLRNSSEIAASPLSIGFECLDRELFNPVPCYDRAAELGVKHARCQTAWNRCETEKGRYNFAWLDDVVDQLLRRGIRPWLSFVYGNPLYMNDIPHPSAVGCAPTAFGPECLAAWKRYVGATTEHFRNRVDTYEIWNEPNIDSFWYPTQATGANYAELVRETAEVIRGVQPEAKIIACMSSIQPSFVQQALKHGIGEWIHAFATHPYSQIPENNYARRTRHLQKLLAEYAPDVKVWQGECGYPAEAFGHKDDNWLVLYNANETTHAKYVIRRVFLDRKLGLELTSYFHLADLLENPYRSADGKAQRYTKLGLLKTRDYLPKLGFHAMRRMAVLFDSRCEPELLSFEVEPSGYDLRNEGALPRLGIQYGSFLRDGYPFYGYYLAEDLQREWFGRCGITLVTLDETDRPINDPVLIDPLTGTVWRPLDAERRPNGEVCYRDLPLTDYPLFLTDRKAIELA